jgi:peptidylprolyl isomerase
VRKRFSVVALLVMMAALAGCGQDAAKTEIKEEETTKTMQKASELEVMERDGMYSSAPEMMIDSSKKYLARISTSEGDFSLELFADKAPITVNSFVFLAREGYYDGVTFHRILKTFVLQAGDPKGDGTGGPGYQFADELPPTIPYGPGVVAMANAGPGTNGSQFFVCTGVDAANLNQYPNYTVFGKVVEGMEIVEKIAAVPVEMSRSGEMSSPVEPVFITKVEIDEN